MNFNDSQGVFRRALITLLVPPFVGMIVVVLLMVGMYWSSLNILFETFSHHYQIFQQFIREFRYYAGLVGFALAMGIILVLLFGVYFLNFFVEPLEKLQEIVESGFESDESLAVRLKGWVYYQLRQRLLLLVIAGMVLTFLLMASLYVLSLNYLLGFSILESGNLEKIITVLRYYGSLTFFALILSGILILLISLRRLKEVVGINNDELNQVKDDIKKGHVDLDSLGEEMDRAILEADIEAMTE